MNAIITLNAGSSSLKFSVYLEGDELAELIVGQVENLGPAATIEFQHPGDAEKVQKNIGTADHKIALTEILKVLEPLLDIYDGEGHKVIGVGHRVVHGGIEFDAPDEKPVDLLFCILVPEESNDQHVKLLSTLAQRFSDKLYREKLRNAADDQDLYDLATMELCA